jgi:hypothetical protein
MFDTSKEFTDMISYSMVFYIKFIYAKLLNNFSKYLQSMSDKSLIYSTLVLDLGSTLCKNTYREWHQGNQPAWL